MTPPRQVYAVILAAGKGTRMKSDLPKVLHRICGRSMLAHVLDAVEASGVARSFIITGHGEEHVRREVGSRATCILQAEQLGTAHAVMMAAPTLAGFDGDVLVCCGDTPLLRAESLAAIVARRRQHHSAAIVLTAELDSPRGYGRIVRNRGGSVLKIVEQKDASVTEDAIREVNTGVYCFDCKLLLGALDRVGRHNAQKEYYLTDVVQILASEGHEVEGLKADDPTEVVGVNSRKDMAAAEAYMRRRVLDTLMADGVTVIDPATTYVDRTVRIGRDTVLHPFTMIEGETVVGAECRLGPGTIVRDSMLGDRVEVMQSTVLGSAVADGARIGPFAVAQPGSDVGAGERIGAFTLVEGEAVGDEDSARLDEARPHGIPPPNRGSSADATGDAPSVAPAVPRTGSGEIMLDAPSQMGGEVHELFPSGWRPKTGTIPPDVQRQLMEIAALRDERLKRREAERRATEGAEAARRRILESGGRVLGTAPAAADGNSTPAPAAAAASWEESFGATPDAPLSPREDARARQAAGGRVVAVDLANPDLLVMERAVDVLLNGGLIAFPTDTVFGLACDGTNAKAVARLRAAKARPEEKPLVAMVHTVRMVRAMIREISEAAETLMEACWPGPLTLVFKRPKALLVPLSDGPTLGLRLPDHLLALSIISMIERPLAVTSVNLSGEPPSLTAAEVDERLGDRIDLILDTATPAGGVASTVVDVSVSPPKILRPGPLTADRLRELLGGAVAE